MGMFDLDQGGVKLCLNDDLERDLGEIYQFGVFL